MSIYKSRDASETSASQKPHKDALAVERTKRGDSQAAARSRHGEIRLVNLAKQGDKRAVGELYRRHVDMIYRYTYARVKDVAVAEDLTAQVFLKALEGLDSYQPTGVPFSAWLYRIAHARTVDHWRQQQRRQEVMLPETMPSRAPQPDDVAIAKSEWNTALDLLDRLTDDQRDVIILRFIEEMSLAEVAELLDKTVGAVKALQHRALASLARLLKQRSASLRDFDD